jgi:hypothetical protein
MQERLIDEAKARIQILNQLERAYRNEAAILKACPGNPRAFFPNKSVRTRVRVALRRAKLEGLKLHVKEASPAGAPWYTTDRANIGALLMALDVAPVWLDGYYELDEETAKILTYIKTL